MLNYRFPIFQYLSLVLVLLWPGLSVADDAIFTHAQSVSFNSAEFSYPISSFKLKLAKKQGKEPQARIEAEVAITGYLALPAGDGPHPAVVMLHTCAGLSEHDEAWSLRLQSWGYVVLSVDSFTPRGFEYICDGRLQGGALTTPWIRALDAYGAKRFLASQPFVDPERIAVIGMSHGAMTVLEVVKQSLTDGLQMQPFQAAVAFYPLCGQPAPINTSVRVLVGDLDTWTPAYLCETLVSQLESRFDISVTVFADTHHAFDHPGIDMIDAGHRIRTNPEATAIANTIVRALLEQKL
ncbi:MAG: dienelactone hydrolase family protein [Pseudomonadota bacterium]